jgi:K+-transporting ATPase A subunit
MLDGIDGGGVVTAGAAHLFENLTALSNIVPMPRTSSSTLP